MLLAAPVGRCLAKAVFCDTSELICPLDVADAEQTIQIGPQVHLVLTTSVRERTFEAAVELSARFAAQRIPSVHTSSFR